MTHTHTLLDSSISSDDSNLKNMKSLKYIKSTVIFYTSLDNLIVNQILFKLCYHLFLRENLLKQRLVCIKLVYWPLSCMDQSIGSTLINSMYFRCCLCLIWGYQNILYNLNLDGLVRLSAWVITLPKVLLYSHTFLVYVTLDFKYMLKYSWSHQHLKSIEITAIYQAEWSIINFVKPPQTFEKL